MYDGSNKVDLIRCDVAAAHFPFSIFIYKKMKSQLAHSIQIPLIKDGFFQDAYATCGMRFYVESCIALRNEFIHQSSKTSCCFYLDVYFIHKRFFGPFLGCS